MSSLLWVTWKDYKHPESGGAEVVSHELTTRLANEGHEVTVLTKQYPGALPFEKKGNISYVRVGSNRYTHPFQALAYYLRNMRGQFDVVVEEVQGCAPYFISMLEKRSKKFYFYHQLARVNWLYEVPKPFAYIGYGLLAPAATWAASLAKVPVITVSESTRQVLSKYGFKPEQTHIISEGLHFKPLSDLRNVQKYDQPTVLSFGAMRAMKRTIDQVKAFEYAKQSLPELQMKIAGSSSGKYGQQVLEYIDNSPYKDDIEYLGKVSHEQKAMIMQRSHLILVTSVEEGWGLIVSEANGQGTPAVVYDVSGLRDSVQHNRTGLTTQPRPEALAADMVELLTNGRRYRRFQSAAHALSCRLTFERSYQDFKTAVGLV